MKRRLLAAVLSAAMVTSMLPSISFAAATGTWDMDINVSENTDVTYNEKNTLELAFGVQSDNLYVSSVQNACVAVDLEIFDILNKNGKQVSPGADLSSAIRNGFYNVYVNDDTEIYWDSDTKIYCCQDQAGKIGYISMQPAQSDAKHTVVEETELVSVLLGFKEDKSIDDLTTGSIRFMTQEEAAKYNQPGVVCLKQVDPESGDKVEQYFLPTGTGKDELTVTPEIDWGTIEVKKPAYDGEVAAPTVAKNTGGMVNLTVMQIENETVQYGFSTVNDAAQVTNWQDSAEFTGLTVGEIYYFFARVKETETHQAKASAGLEVTVKAAELTGIAVTPETTTVDVPLWKDGPKTIAFTATGTYDDGTTADVTNSVTWSYTCNPGTQYLTFENGVLKVRPEANKTTVTVKATSGGVSGTATVVLNKESGVATYLELSADETSVNVPAKGQTATVQINASCKDQYGNGIRIAYYAWSIEGNPAGVKIESGVLTVDHTALPGTVKVICKDGTNDQLSESIEIAINKADATVAEITVTAPNDADWAVPTVTSSTGSAEKKVQLSAAVFDQFGDSMAKQTVTWSIPATTGVTINETTGELTITNQAKAESITVTAACGGKTGTLTVALTRESENAASFIEISNAAGVIADGAAQSVKLPATGETTATFTAKAYNQYGEELQDTITWTVTDEAGTDPVTVADGTITVKPGAVRNITLKAAVGNTAEEITVKLVEKPDHVVSDFAESALTATYGSAMTGQTVTVADNTGAVVYSSSDPTAVAVDAATGALTIKKATVNPVTITATVAETPEYKGVTKTYTVQVNQKALTVSGLEPEDRTYEKDNLEVALGTGKLEGIVGEDDVTATMPNTGTMADANVGEDKVVTIATITLTGEASGNYTLTQPTGKTVTITKAVPDIEVVLACPTMTIYESNLISEVALLDTKGTVSGALTWTKVDGKDQILTVGTKDYDWTFTPTDTANYEVKTGKLSLTVEADAITGIAVTTAPTKTTGYKYGDEFDAAGMVVTATYASGKTQDITEQVTYEKKLTVGQTKITLTYQEMTCDVTIEAVAKGTWSTTSVEMDASFGESEYLDLTEYLPEGVEEIDIYSVTDDTDALYQLDDDAVALSLVGNTLVWAIKDDADTGSQVVVTIAVPASENYEAYELTVTLTVALKKVDLTLTPSKATLSGGGTITVTVGGLPEGGEATVTVTPSVTLKDNENGTFTVTLPNTTTEYTFTAEYAGDDETYRPATATCTVKVTQYTAPAGGGGGGSYGGGSYSDSSSTNTTTTTTKNPDGSTTTTKVDKNTGVTTETTKSPDGSESTVKTDKNGNVTADVSVSSSAATQAAKENKPVALPMPEIAAGSNSANAPKVEISVPKNAADFKVEIPVENVTAGTVIILVDKNGKETVVPKSAMTENGVTMNVSEDVTVKIVDNSEKFGDVSENSWYADATAFVSARELFTGTGDNKSSPQAPMTRAMLAVVLYALESKPETNVVPSFTDVGDSWYTTAIGWATDRGIMSGYGDGRVGAQDNITREQLAMMLYTFIGKPESTTTLDRFSDANNASGYAQDALRWAVENGVMSGNGDGTLNPKGQATRAEVAAMLKSFVNNAV